MHGTGQLIGTGGVLVSATDTLQLADHFIGPHPSHECRNALQVAVTTSCELDILYDALFIDIKVYLGRTRPLRIIGIFHLLILDYLFHSNKPRTSSTRNSLLSYSIMPSSWSRSSEATSVVRWVPSSEHRSFCL